MRKNSLLRHALLIAMQIAASVDAEQRYDVREFLICFAPLLSCGRKLPDKSWTLLLSLLGVGDVSGEVVDDHTCSMRGVMRTHPPVEISMRLKAHIGASTMQYSLTSIELH